MPMGWAWICRVIARARLRDAHALGVDLLRDLAGAAA